MSAPSPEQIERFRKRVERTEEHTLDRNIRAGVYGPPGSTRRAVAERALELKHADQVQVVSAATAHERSEVIAAARRATSAARWALVVSILAGLVALLAAARSFGVL